MIFVLFFTGVIIALFTPAVAYVTANQHCRVCLSNIGEVLHAYHEEHGHFPPTVIRGEDGKPWHSWRSLVLQEYLEEENYDLSQPWKAPGNKAARKFYPRWITCFVAQGVHDKEEPIEESRYTTYVAVQGDDTAWRADGTPRSLKEIADPANTAMVIELANSKIQDIEPKDIQLDDLLSGRIAWDRLTVHKYDDGLVYPQPSTNILFADGSVRRCIGIPTKEEIRQLFSIKEKPVTPANRHDRENYVFGDRRQVFAKQPVRAIVYYTWWTSLAFLFIAAIWPRRLSREQ